MKRTISLVLAAMIICSMALVGCTDTETTSSEDSSAVSVETEESFEEEESSEEESEAEELTGEVVGMITAVAEDSITIDVYVTESGDAIEDYTRVDLDTLSADGTSGAVSVTDETIYYTTEPSTYNTTDLESLAEGDMIAVTTGSDGVQWVIVLSDMEEASEEEEEVSEETDGTEESTAEEESAETEESADTEESTDAEAE